MSGVRTSVMVSSPGCFFTFRAARVAGRWSATAAAITTTRAPSACSSTARASSSADTTSTTSTSAGRGSSTGPEMSVTRAPRSRAASAIAYPMRPEEGLDR